MVSLSKGPIGKIFMQDLSVEKSMNGQEPLFTVEDIPTIIYLIVGKAGSENKFRILYQCYVKCKKNILEKQVDTSEILNNIVSYFTILFMSPDALEVYTTESKEVVENPQTFGDMPNLPPEMANNPMMAQMMQMMMKSQNNIKTHEEVYTNIENEFYQVVVEDGVIVANKEFMDKVLEE